MIAMTRKNCSGKFLSAWAGLILGGLCVAIWLASEAVPAWSQAQRGGAAKSPRRPAATRTNNPASEPVSAKAANEEANRPAAPADAADKVVVSAVRFLSSSDYTRVMVDLSRNAPYEVRQLKEDIANRLPPRIYVDIQGARLALDAKEAMAVDDGLLRQVRVGQYSQDVVRLVLDMTSLRAHNAFLLPDPYRLVIDVQGQKRQAKAPSAESTVSADPAARKPAALNQRPHANNSGAGALRKIVLDPGHGGKDPGAIGVGGVAEKDIVLSIAKKLAVKLRNEMGVQVVLTRRDDRFLALENRTALANAEDADLFISLHMNASANGDAHGVETYYLDNTTDEAAIRLAARENGTSRKNVSDLQFILSDMTQNMKLEESITLAHRLQGSMVGGMSKVMNEVKDLGVKKALFYVLVGARMPSVLVEMFFITHRAEGRAMSQQSYQDAMVDALFEGIQKHGQSTLVARTL